MTRGELERAHQHYVRWADLRRRRDRIAEQGMQLCAGDERITDFFPPDHALTRALIGELQHHMANEEQILTFLGVDMRDDAPANTA